MEGNSPPSPHIPCLRVTLLDAEDLDEYLVELLMRKQLDKCLKLFFPKYLTRIKPELQTGLYALLMYCTVGKLHQTVGQKLFGVMLSESQGLGLASKKKIWIFICMEIFLYWWKTRYNDVHPSFISSRPRLAKSLDVVISATKLLEVISFVLFLRTGEFNRLLLRILGLRIVFDHPNPDPGSISYTILSREILWRGFAEATMYFLSLFDVPQLKKYVLDSFVERDVKPDLKACGICKEWPTQPYEADCSHVFCYYCLHTAVTMQSRCPVCDSIITGLRAPKHFATN